MCSDTAPKPTLLFCIQLSSRYNAEQFSPPLSCEQHHFRVEVLQNKWGFKEELDEQAAGPKFYTLFSPQLLEGNHISLQKMFLI